MAIAYRLLLLAQTVQNFSLKLLSGGCSPGFCPFVAGGFVRSSFPSRPMVVVSGSASGGGGGGGGCARRLGSADMMVVVWESLWNDQGGKARRGR